MSPYIILYFTIIFAAVISIWRRGKIEQVLWFSSFIILCLFVGTRYQVGGDWEPYLLKFYQAKEADLYTGVRWNSDPLFWLLNWGVSNLGFNIAYLNTIYAALSIGGLMYFSKHQPLPWLALLIMFPYLILIVGMGYVKQSIAVGFLAAAFTHNQLNNRRLAWTFCIVGSLFHVSAVIFIPLLLATRKNLRWWHLIIFSAIIYFFMEYLVIAKYQADYYKYFDNSRASSGAAIRIAMTLPTAILGILLYKRLGLANEAMKHWYYMLISFFGILPVMFFSTTVADRIAVFYLLIQPLILCRLVNVCSKRVYRQALSAAIIILYLIVLAVWFSFAENAYQWIPYDSFIIS